MGRRFQLAQQGGPVGGDAGEPPHQLAAALIRRGAHIGHIQTRFALEVLDQLAGLDP